MAKQNSKSARTAAVSAKSSPSEISFADIKAGLCEDKVVFRLMHFWTAQNPNKGGILIGLELLLINDKSTVIQAFIAPNRIARFEGRLQAGTIYSLANFFATPNKTMYRVSDHNLTICFTDSSILSALVDQARVIDSDRFRFHTFEQFEMNCDKRSYLNDIIGHVKLINGYTLHQLSEKKIAFESDKGRVSIHLQPKEGPVLSSYLWDKVAAEFRRIFDAIDGIPSVLMVTTIIPKNVGVYCEGCVVDMAQESEKIKCQECHIYDPRGFPKVCLLLEQLLEENFPEEYNSRRSGIHKTLPHNSKGNIRSYQREGPSLSDDNNNNVPWANTASNVHIGAGCDCCGVYPIIGERYRCRDCTEEIGYDLCKDCYETPSIVPGRFNQQHTPEHRLELAEAPQVLVNIFDSVGLLIGPMTYEGMSAEDSDESEEQEVAPDSNELL